MKEPKGGKGKKGKGTKLSLGDFNAFPVGRSRQLSDKEILMQLPKGSSGLPKEEGAKGLGGGFKDYGGNRGERGEQTLMLGDQPNRSLQTAEGVAAGTTCIRWLGLV